MMNGEMVKFILSSFVKEGDPKGGEF